MIECATGPGVHTIAWPTNGATVYIRVVDVVPGSYSLSISR